jgi:hypothetical protein
VQIIECWLNKVRDIEIVEKPEAFGLTGPLATTPVLSIRFEGDWVNAFEAYYAASREPHVRGPHHAFANITAPDAIGPFFKRFGFPRFEGGRPTTVGDVLIEAKRLRLLMEAWDAFRVSNLALARERLGELTFAQHFNAAWFYWPPVSLFVDDADSREAVESQRQHLEREHRRATEEAKEYSTKDSVRQALILAAWRTCADPLRQVEFAPEIGPGDRGQIDVRWALRPVRFLGESEMHGIGIPHEEAYIGAPYGLMFLLDQTEGIETRVCADQFCRQLFGAGRSNQTYCSRACAHRVAQRRSRERSRLARNDRGRRRR